MKILFCLSVALWLFLGGVPAGAGDKVLIPTGPFIMGEGAGESDEQPVHRVFLDAFYIDRYPVTNAQYAAFLNQFGNQKEGGEKWLDTDSLFSPWLCKIKTEGGRFVPRKGYENCPVIKVSWFGARAYARWKGKRLPTEAEWEKAARGGLIGQRHVYGNILTPEQANIAGCYAARSVGSYPPNGYGLYDMVAQVWQWCEDWYDPNYYGQSPYANPKGPVSGTLKVLRGGSWFHKDSWRVADRGTDDPLSHHYCFVTGFRCARDAVK